MARKPAEFDIDRLNNFVAGLNETPRRIADDALRFIDPPVSAQQVAAIARYAADVAELAAALTGALAERIEAERAAEGPISANHANDQLAPFDVNGMSCAIFTRDTKNEYGAGAWGWRVCRHTGGEAGTGNGYGTRREAEAAARAFALGDIA